MIKIFLCEDNPEQLKLWSNTISEYLTVSEADCVLELQTPNPKKLLEHLQKAQLQTGLYFLDISLSSEMNGLQLAAEIRKLDPRGYIVFITSHSEMSYMTFQYKVEALDFILKDDIDGVSQRIRDCIKVAVTNHQNAKKSKRETLTIKIGGQHIVLDLDDIVCIETSKNTIHKLSLYTLTGVKSMYGTLKEIEASLNGQPNFIRCYKSVIVNSRHIQRVDGKNKELVLETGKTCPFSSRRISPKVLSALGSEQ